MPELSKLIFCIGTENVEVIDVQTVFWVGFVSFGLIVVQKTSRLAWTKFLGVKRLIKKMTLYLL